MYKVQINMAEIDENPQWEDCDYKSFATIVEAFDYIDWMLCSYSKTFEYRVVELNDGIHK
jgi:hypothetical protein